MKPSRLDRLQRESPGVAGRARLPGLARGEVQPRPVAGGAAGRTLAAPDAPRKGALPGDDHHLRLDPDVGEGSKGRMGCRI